MTQLPPELIAPIKFEDVLSKRKSLLRQLRQRAGLQPLRIAILGGSTTADVRDMLEIFLLAGGIAPDFYESGYNQYYEDVMFHNPDLFAFRPDIVVVHTTQQNITCLPALLDSEADVERTVRAEMDRCEGYWAAIESGLGALVIQNNFDFPRLRVLGNLDTSAFYGRRHHVLRLNLEFARYAQTHPRFLVNDILSLSAEIGMKDWSDPSYWYQYHMAVSPVGAAAIGKQIANLISAIYGRSKKCLVLDLDNTLWGGVVGDDGVKGLVLGRDHPAGEAYLNFQEYVKNLGRRGVLLAVCSKNDEENAKAGFSHPDSILSLADFSGFKANWRPKPHNIRELAIELNIGLDSMVFLDDNPAERALVSASLPEVAVPNAGSDVECYAEILENGGYFEPIRIVKEDLDRGTYYGANRQRQEVESSFADYDAFLLSLEMTAEILPFQPVYLERIAQLVNKTNQFNLTTRRYTFAQIEAISRDTSAIGLSGRLTDRFGDNGLVSVVIGTVHGGMLQLDAWLMSCRVLKRGMELAMFDALVEECRIRDIREIQGTYIPSKKNAMVAGLYRDLGFEEVLPGSSGQTSWRYQIPSIYQPKAYSIRRTPGAVALAAQG
jgi:FkbH-like protein